MKRIIYYFIGLWACGFYTGCSENKIALYDQEPRINFYSYRTAREFVDTDYVKKTPYIVDSFQIAIQGDFLTEKRNFCVKQAVNSDYEHSLSVELENKYTYTDLASVTQKFPYKIIRPELKADRKIYGCFLEFDLNNPDHSFPKGLVEKHQLVVHVSWQLKPTDWEEWPWGEYSDAKYIFMMDVCKCIFSELKDEDYDKVVAAYKQYKEDGNPPILDDKGKEIQFE